MAIITVPIAGDEISVQRFGAPVANAINAYDPFNSDSGWVDLALTTGWTNTTDPLWGNVAVRKVGKLCSLRGLPAATTAAGQTLAVLPVGYRPQFKAMYFLQVYPANDYNQSRMDVSTDGTIAFPWRSAVSLSYVGLGNVVWFTA